MKGSSRRRRVPALLVLTALGAGTLALGAPANATADFAITRIAGDNRSATAAALALQTFPSGAGTALISRDDAFPDALAGNYSAGLLSAPLLLSGTDALPSATTAALSTLGVDAVVMLGGLDALSRNVENQLRGMGLAVSRIAGVDRFDTAAQLARAAGVGAVGRDELGRRTAVLSSGLNFPDALAAGPIVFSEHFPQLLTGASALPATTRQVLIDLSIEHVIITGGGAAIPTSIEGELATTGVTSSERIAGDTRFTTALALANKAGTSFGFQASHVNLATGGNFPDALAGGPHAGLEQVPIILVPAAASGADFNAVCGALSAIAPVVASGHAFGGVAAIADALLAALDNCATPTGPVAGTGQVVRVNGAANQYTFVDNATNAVRLVSYDDQDTFRVDGGAVSIGVFKANIAPGDQITFTDDTSAANADAHALTNLAVTQGRVGNVDVADNSFAIINPVTGDVVGGPFQWSDVLDTFSVNGLGASLAVFEGSINEGDTVNLTMNGTDPTALALTNGAITGKVTDRSVSDPLFAAFGVDNAFGDEAEGAQNTVFVAQATPPATTAETYAVDGAVATFAQFAFGLSVGDTVSVKREVVGTTPTETFTLTNVAPQAIAGQVTSFINIAEDPTPSDPSGDRFASVPAGGGYQTVDYSSTPALTGFRIGATTVNEAEFEAALTPGDTIVFQPGSTSPAVTESITLTNAPLQGQLFAINIDSDLYGIYATDKATLLALVGYTTPGTPPLTNQYFINGIQRSLAQWEAEAADVNVGAGELDDTILVEPAGSFRNHRLTTNDPITP